MAAGVLEGSYTPTPSFAFAGFTWAGEAGKPFVIMDRQTNQKVKEWTRYSVPMASV
jgi:hypothetical protein